MSAAPAMVRNPVHGETELTNRPVSEAESSAQRSQISTEDDIARLAYALWQQRGCPADSADSDWIEAEQQLGQAAKQRSRVNQA